MKTYNKFNDVYKKIINECKNDFLKSNEATIHGYISGLELPVSFRLDFINQPEDIQNDIINYIKELYIINENIPFTNKYSIYKDENEINSMKKRAKNLIEKLIKLKNHMSIDELKNKIKESINDNTSTKEKIQIIKNFVKTLNVDSNIMIYLIKNKN